MAIDPSIALGGQQPNILQNLLGVQQFKGAQLQQQQVDQAMRANSAVSQAYQAATNPQTGEVDQNALIAAISQNPDAAYNLPTIQGQLLEQRNKQLEFDKNQFELAQKRTTALKNGLGSFINKPDLSQKDIIGMIATGVKDGTATPEQAVRYMQDMPSDPAKLREWATQKYLQSLGDDAQLKAMLPQTQILNTGGQQQILNIDPLTGQPRVAGNLQNTLSPEAASTPTTVFNPQTGAQEIIPRSQFVAGAQGVAPGGAPMSGRYPGQAPQTFQAGPSLGQAAAAETLGKGSAEGALSLQQTAEGSPQRVYFLQDMMAQLPKFESGPTADWTAKANALALQLAPGVAAKMGIDPQSVASKEEFTKFATNLAINTSAGLGAGTDSKLATAVAGNPNASLSKLGNEQIMKVLIGTERATQAKNMAWQNSGEQPQNYGKWSAQWNKDVDPRVFVAPELTQAERVKMFKGLSEKDRAAFSRSYNQAVRDGIIQRPGT